MKALISIDNPLSSLNEKNDTFYYELPEGWKWLNLGQILIKKPQYGLTSKSIGKKTKNNILYIRISDVNPLGKLDLSTPRYVDIDERTYEKYRVQIGDILIARSGATAGKAFLCRQQINAVFASYMIRFQIIKEIMIPKYLFLFLQSPLYWKQIQEWKVGGAQPNVNAQNLKRIRIPVPPLEIQKKIVDKFEHVIRKVSELKKIRKKSLDDREKILQSVIHFFYSIANEKKWELIELGEITEINREKINLKKEKNKKEFTYIDISSIENGTGLIKKPKKMLWKKAPSRARRIVHTNNIILSTVRPYLKAHAIIPEKYDSEICSTGFAVLNCSNKILPKYLLFSLFSHEVLEQCNSMMMGAHYPALRLNQVKKIKIILPPIETQKTIVNVLDSIHEKIHKLENLEITSNKIIENIIPSSLDKAFKGS